MTCINNYERGLSRTESLARLLALGFFILAIMLLIPWEFLATATDTVMRDSRAAAAMFAVTASSLLLLSYSAPSLSRIRVIADMVSCALFGGGACGRDIRLDNLLRWSKRFWRIVAGTFIVIVMLGTAIAPAFAENQLDTSSVEIVGIDLPEGPVRVVLTWGNNSIEKEIQGGALSVTLEIGKIYIRAPISLRILSNDGHLLLFASFEPSPAGYTLTRLEVSSGISLKQGAAIIIKEVIWGAKLIIRPTIPIGTVSIKVNNVSLAASTQNGTITAEWISSPRPQVVEVRSRSDSIEWKAELITSIAIASQGPRPRLSGNLIYVRGNVSPTDAIDIKLIPFKQLAVTIINLSNMNLVGERQFGTGSGALLYLIPPPNQGASSSNPDIGAITHSGTESTTTEAGVNIYGFRVSPSTLLFLGIAVAVVGALWRRRPWNTIVTMLGLAIIAYTLFMIPKG